MKFIEIKYGDLNACQKEAYNFQKGAAILADYGYITILLSSDWGGADFIAQHKDGEFFKVQLKGRVTISKKYLGKDLYICFHDKRNDKWYMVPHDDLAKELHRRVIRPKNKTWEKGGCVSYGAIPQKLMPYLEDYAIPE